MIGSLTSRSEVDWVGNIVGTPSWANVPCCFCTMPSHAGNTLSRSNFCSSFFSPASSSYNTSDRITRLRVGYAARTSASCFDTPDPIIVPLGKPRNQASMGKDTKRANILCLGNFYLLFILSKNAPPILPQPTFQVVLFLLQLQKYQATGHASKKSDVPVLPP